MINFSCISTSGRALFGTKWMYHMHCNMDVILELCAQISVYLPRFTFYVSPTLPSHLFRVMIGISAVLVSRR